MKGSMGCRGERAVSAAEFQIDGVFRASAHQSSPNRKEEPFHVTKTEYKAVAYNPPFKIRRIRVSVREGPSLICDYQSKYYRTSKNQQPRLQP